MLTDLSASAMSKTVDQPDLADGTEGDAPHASLPMPSDLPPMAGKEAAGKAANGAGKARPAAPAAAASAAPLTSRPSFASTGGAAATPAGQLPVSLLGRGSAGGACSASRLLGASPFHNFAAAVDGLGYASNVDDFLDELRRALDDTGGGATPSGGAPASQPRRTPAEISAAALNAVANAVDGVVELPATAAGPTPSKAKASAPAENDENAAPAAVLPSSALGSAHGCFFALGSVHGPSSRLTGSALPAWRRDSLGGTPSVGLGRESLGFDLLSPINDAAASQSSSADAAASDDAASALPSQSDMQDAMQAALSATSVPGATLPL